MVKQASTRKIVSSRHLATEGGWQLSEFEFGLIVAYNGFSRWVTRCMTAAGNADMGTLDVLVLHNIFHRSRAKRLSDICFMLNIEDTHTVNYAVKKLLKQDLIRGEKNGKEIFYTTTAEGGALCEKYREMREQCLVESLGRSGASGEELREIAATLRSLSGLYDQASRTASSL